jgi:hypothetical protein
MEHGSGYSAVEERTTLNLEQLARGGSQQSRQTQQQGQQSGFGNLTAFIKTTQTQLASSVASTCEAARNSGLPENDVHQIVSMIYEGRHDQVQQWIQQQKQFAQPQGGGSGGSGWSGPGQ